MIPDSDYKVLTSVESSGTHGLLAVKILVAAPPGVDLENRQLRNVACAARESIQNELLGAIKAADPATQQQTRMNRNGILGLFPTPIFVEEIPNGYCPDACCRHLPWFIVTTTVGRFKIGWRKSVIAIDWTDTRGTKTSEELFPHEDVTKSGKSIHAWGYEPAKKWIAAVIASAPMETKATDAAVGAPD